jgi:hypothetical protein
MALDNNWWGRPSDASLLVASFSWQSFSPHFDVGGHHARRFIQPSINRPAVGKENAGGCSTAPRRQKGT